MDEFIEKTQENEMGTFSWNFQARGRTQAINMKINKIIPNSKFYVGHKQGR